MLQRGQRLGDRLVSFRQGHRGGVGAFDEILGVRQALLLGAQLLPLAFGQAQLLDLVEFPPQTLGADLDLAGAALRKPQRLVGLLPSCMDFRHFRNFTLQFAEAVEQVALRAGAHQHLRFVLAVDVDQHLADFPQQRDGGGVAVDLGAGSAIRFQNSPDEKMPGIATQVSLFEPLLDGRSDHELRADVGTIGAFPHHCRIAAGADRQTHGIQQDGFARAGFSGEGREAGAEFDLGGIDDDEVLQA
jgi:hypothetical protein